MHGQLKMNQSIKSVFHKYLHMALGDHVLRAMFKLQIAHNLGKVH